MCLSTCGLSPHLTLKCNESDISLCLGEPLLGQTERSKLPHRSPDELRYHLHKTFSNQRLRYLCRCDACVCVRVCMCAYACGCMRLRGNGGASFPSLDKGTNGACGCCGNLCLNVAAQGSPFLHTSHTYAPALPPPVPEHASCISDLNSGCRDTAESPRVMQHALHFFFSWKIRPIK